MKKGLGQMNLFLLEFLTRNLLIKVAILPDSILVGSFQIGKKFWMGRCRALTQSFTDY